MQRTPDRNGTFLCTSSGGSGALFCICLFILMVYIRACKVSQLFRYCYLRHTRKLRVSMTRVRAQCLNCPCHFTIYQVALKFSGWYNDASSLNHILLKCAIWIYFTSDVNDGPRNVLRRKHIVDKIFQFYTTFSAHTHAYTLYITLYIYTGVTTVPMIGWWTWNVCIMRRIQIVKGCTEF